MGMNDADRLVDIILEMEDECYCGRRAGHIGWFDCVQEEQKRRSDATAHHERGSENDG